MPPAPQHGATERTFAAHRRDLGQAHHQWLADIAVIIARQPPRAISMIHVQQQQMHGCVATGERDEAPPLPMEPDES